MIVLNQDVPCLWIIKARGVLAKGLVILYCYLRHWPLLRHNYWARAASKNDKVCITQTPSLPEVFKSYAQAWQITHPLI